LRLQPGFANAADNRIAIWRERSLDGLTMADIALEFAYAGNLEHSRPTHKGSDVVTGSGCFGGKGAANAASRTKNYDHHRNTSIVD
jgi:hypothetical protein